MEEGFFVFVGWIEVYDRFNHSHILPPPIHDPTHPSLTRPILYKVHRNCIGRVYGADSKDEVCSKRDLFLLIL